MLYLLFVHLFSCRLTSQRELVFTLSVTTEQRGWETASLEFKGSLLGICTVKEELIDYGWSIVQEVYYAVLYGSTQTIRVVSQIYRERTIEDVSANEEKIDVIKSDQSDGIVPVVSVKLGLFSNLQLNEPKWGTIQFNSILYFTLWKIFT